MSVNGVQWRDALTGHREEDNSVSITAILGMEVWEHNYESALVAFKRELDRCEFVSVDLEFSGLRASSESRKPCLFDEPETRYAPARDTARLFTPFQLGLCTFRRTSEQPDAGLVAMPFAFNLLPLAQGSYLIHYRPYCRSITLAAGASTFLMGLGISTSTSKFQSRLMCSFKLGPIVFDCVSLLCRARVVHGPGDFTSLPR